MSCRSCRKDIQERRGTNSLYQLPKKSKAVFLCDAKTVCVNQLLAEPAIDCRCVRTTNGSFGETDFSETKSLSTGQRYNTSASDEPTRQNWTQIDFKRSPQSRPSHGFRPKRNHFRGQSSRRALFGHAGCRSIAKCSQRSCRNFTGGFRS